MEYKTTSAQRYGDEIVSPPEAARSYAEFEHAELISQFYEAEGDPDIGRELSIRLFGHAGVTVDPRTVPLVGRDGAQVKMDGESLMLSDYVNFAVQRHFEAVPGILDFLMQRPGGSDYETTRATILARLSADKQ